MKYCCCGNRKKIHLKPICSYLCLQWGTCIYSDQHAFIAILSIDKNMNLGYVPPDCEVFWHVMLFPLIIFRHYHVYHNTLPNFSLLCHILSMLHRL